MQENNQDPVRKKADDFFDLLKKNGFSGVNDKEELYNVLTNRESAGQFYDLLKKNKFSLDMDENSFVGIFNPDSGEESEKKKLLSTKESKPLPSRESVELSSVPVEKRGYQEPKESNYVEAKADIPAQQKFKDKYIPTAEEIEKDRLTNLGGLLSMVNKKISDTQIEMDNLMSKAQAEGVSLSSNVSEQDYQKNKVYIDAYNRLVRDYETNISRAQEIQEKINPEQPLERGQIVAEFGEYFEAEQQEKAIMGMAMTNSVSNYLESAKRLMEKMNIKDITQLTEDERNNFNASLSMLRQQQEKAKVAEMQFQYGDLNMAERFMEYINTIDKRIINLGPDFIETYAVLNDKIVKGLGLRSADESVLNDPLYKFSRNIREEIEEFAPTDPRYRGTLQHQTADAVGTVIPMLFTGGMSSGSKKATDLLLKEMANTTKKETLGATVKKVLKQVRDEVVNATTAIPAAQIFASEYDGAIQQGANEDEAFEQALKNMVVGSALERLPIGQFFRRLDNLSGGGVKDVLARGIKGGIEEYTTEVLQGVYSNMTAKEIFDYNREIFNSDLLSENVPAFIVGSLLSGMGGGISNRKPKSKNTEETQQEPEISEEQQFYIDQALADIEFYKNKYGVEETEGKNPEQPKKDVKPNPADDIQVQQQIGKRVIFKGPRGPVEGELTFDPESLQRIVVKSNNEIYEVGSRDELFGQPISKFNMSLPEANQISRTESGNIKVRDEEYVNKYSDKRKAVEFDEDGYVKSVNLETVDGKKRNFKGLLADELAYEILYGEIDEEKFNQYLETNEGVQTIIQDNETEVRQSSTEGKGSNTEKVSGRKLEKGDVIKPLSPIKNEDYFKEEGNLDFESGDPDLDNRVRNESGYQDFLTSEEDLRKYPEFSIKGKEEYYRLTKMGIEPGVASQIIREGGLNRTQNDIAASDYLRNRVKPKMLTPEDATEKLKGLLNQKLKKYLDNSGTIVKPIPDWLQGIYSTTKEDPVLGTKLMLSRMLFEAEQAIPERGIVDYGKKILPNLQFIKSGFDAYNDVENSNKTQQVIDSIESQLNNDNLFTPTQERIAEVADLANQYTEAEKLKRFIPLRGVEARMKKGYKPKNEPQEPIKFNFEGEQFQLDKNNLPDYVWNYVEKAREIEKFMKPVLYLLGHKDGMANPFNTKGIDAIQDITEQAFLATNFPNSTEHTSTEESVLTSLKTANEDLAMLRNQIKFVSEQYGFGDVEFPGEVDMSAVQNVQEPIRKTLERGSKTESGVTYTRQQPLSNKVEGTEVDVIFSRKPIVSEKGIYTVIEASELQPSHRQGIRNPLHFISEAQPKERTDEASKLAIRDMVDNLNPQEMTEGTDAYHGAPVVNSRGEAIQGNNRSAGIKQYYTEKPNDPAGYKARLKEISSITGIDPDLIDLFDQPVLVKMVKAADPRSIELGQYDAKDIESGGSATVNVANMIGLIQNKKLTGGLLQELIQSDKETLREKILDRIDGILSVLYKGNAVNSTVYEQIKNNPRKFGDQLMEVFSGMVMADSGVNSQVIQGFNSFVQNQINESIIPLLQTSPNAKINNEIGKGILAFSEYKQSGTETPFTTWANSTNAFEAAPRDKYSKLELEIARRMSQSNKKDVLSRPIREYNRLVEFQQPDLMNPDGVQPVSKEDAIQQVFFEGKEDSAPEPKPEPKPKQESKPKQSPTQPKVKSQEAWDKAMKGLKDLNDILGERGSLSSGVDPKALAQGIKVVGHLVEAGIYKLQEIGEAVLSNFGTEAFENLWPAIKESYSAYLSNQATDEEFEAMDSDPRAIRNLKAETVIQEYAKKKAQEQLEEYESSTDTNLEPDSPKSTTENDMGKKDVSPERGGTNEGSEQGGRSNEDQPTRTEREGDTSVSDGDATVGRDVSDTELDTQQGPIGPDERIARGDRSEGSVDIDEDGLSFDIEGNEDLTDDTTVEGARVINNYKLRAAQMDAEEIPAVPKDRANIENTLPILMPHQLNNVYKAENRFFNDPKPGDTNKAIMFTDGTGTGKTYSGLGIVKRFQKMGRNKILIVSPSNETNKAWRAAGNLDFNLDLHILEDTKDNGTNIGKSMVITTVANFRENEAIQDVDWDLVLFDESHKIMESMEGNDTKAYDQFKRLTGHPEGSFYIAKKRFGEKVVNETTGETEYFMTPENTEKVMEEYNRLLDRNKVVFLSASPFVSEKAIRYADDYLFKASYDRAGNPVEQGYDQWVADNLGYQMTPEGLGERPPDVDGSVQRRNLIKRLTARGAISTTRLKLDVDYSRDFIQVDSPIGESLNNAVKMIQSDPDLKNLNSFIEKVWDYNLMTQVLEASIAKGSIKRIKDHLALGRKVVVFHNYRTTTPLSPFDFDGLMDKYLEKQKMDSRLVANILAEGEIFKSKYGEDIDYSLFKDLERVPEIIANAFPEGKVGLFNGGFNNDHKSLQVREFNTDGSQKDVLVVQTQSGKEGISLHDVTGKHQRVMIGIGLPIRSTDIIQMEGRIYRIGSVSNAIYEYLATGQAIEKTLFSKKIPRRTEEAEDLGKGEDARAISSSIINAYKTMQKETDKPVSLDQGIGGKETDEFIDGLSDYEKSYHEFFEYIEGRENQANEITPHPIALKMVELLQYRPGDRILEPSAGEGILGKYLPDSTENTLIEPDYETNAQLVLNTDSRNNFKQVQFEDLSIQGNKFNGILMNPPRGKNSQQAASHLTKAIKHLTDEGRLIAMVPDVSVINSVEQLVDKPEFKNIYKVAEFLLPNEMQKEFGYDSPMKLLIMERHDKKYIGDQISPIKEDYRKKSFNEFLSDFEDFQMPTERLRSAPQAGEVNVDANPVEELNINSQDQLEAFHASRRGVTMKLGEMENRNTGAEEKAKAFKAWEVIARLHKKHNPEGALQEKYNQARTLGTYWPENKGVRLKGMNNLSVAIHEFVHALDYPNRAHNKIMDSSMPGDLIRTSLTEIYTDLYPGGKSSHDLAKRVKEGLAVYFQFRMSNPTLIETKYPELVDLLENPESEYYFEPFMELKKDGDAIVSAFNTLTPLEKIGTAVIQDPLPSDIKKANEKLKPWKNKDFLKQEFFDHMALAERLDREAGIYMTNKDVTNEARMASNAVRLADQNISGNNGYWTYDANGVWKKTFDFNWKSIVKKLGKQIPDFDNFLVARRVVADFDYLNFINDRIEFYESGEARLEMIRNGRDPEAADLIIAKRLRELYEEKLKTVQIIEKDGFVEKVAREALDEGYNTFDSKTIEMYDKLVAADLDFLYAVNMLTNEEYTRLKDNKSYAPFKRQKYDELLGDYTLEDMPQLQSAKNQRIGSLMQRRGSSSPIVSPLLGAQYNHVEFVRKGMKQMVYNKINEHWVDAFPTVFNRDPVRTSGDPKNRFPQDKDPNYIVARDRQGNRVPIKTDAMIKRVIDESFEARNFNMIENVSQMASQLFRLGTTGVYQAFVAVNFALDQTAAFVNSYNNYIPVISPARHFVEAQIFKNSDANKYLQEYLFLAGSTQTRLTADAHSTKEVQDIIKFKKKSALRRASNITQATLNVLSKPGNYSELVTRGTEYIKARKNGKSQAQALEEAGKVSGPFHHMGRWYDARKDKSKKPSVATAKGLVRSIPYANAGFQVLIQTADKLHTKEGLQKYMIAFAALTASAAIAMSRMIDDDDEEVINTMTSLSPDFLTRYMFIPTAGGKIRKFRVPEQLGWATGLLNMAMLQAADKTKYSSGEFAEAATAFLPDQLNPIAPVEMFYSWIPQIVKPGLETVTNYKSFPEFRPIDNASDQRKEPEFRYSDYTLGIAVDLGRELEMSPKKIEHFLRNTFGRSINYTDAFYGKGDRAFGFTQNFQQELYLNSSRQMQRFFDIRTQVEQRENTLNNNPELDTDQNWRKIEEIQDAIFDIEILIEDIAEIDPDREPKVLAKKTRELFKLIEELKEPQK